LIPRFLLDTHVLIRWRADPKRLSREQTRVMDEADRRGEIMAISAFTLVELTTLSFDRAFRAKASIDEFLDVLETSPTITILPITVAIAREARALRILRDPADQFIAAAARVHGLRLITLDQRIIESNTVSTVD
jgi:PIN domain nuclease of toxin-antitoxin system